MQEGLCVSCGEWHPLQDDGYLPYHDWPKPTRRICSGAKVWPLHKRPVMTLDLAIEWRMKAHEGVLNGDTEALWCVDWLLYQTREMLTALQVISRITEDEAGEKPTAEAKLARRTLHKMGHVES